MITESNYLTFQVLENGNLLISLTDEGKEELPEIKENSYDNLAVWFTLLEQTECNGSYAIVMPEKIGALTDSPIICSEASYDENGDFENEDAKFWWFPDYMVIDELQQLTLSGFIEFVKTDD